jgi:hypothetical protein
VVLALLLIAFRSRATSRHQITHLGRLARAWTGCPAVLRLCQVAHEAPSLDWLIFAAGMPAVAVGRLVSISILAAAVVSARHDRDATVLAGGAVTTQRRRRLARSGSAVGEARA